MHQEFDRLETLRKVEVEEEVYHLWEKSKDRHVKINVIYPSEEESIEKMVNDAIQKEMVEDKSDKRPSRSILGWRDLSEEEED